MNKLICEDGIIGVTLEEGDTLGDMAMVSGYTMDKLRGMIEEIIDQSICEEKNRDVCEGGDDDMTNEEWIPCSERLPDAEYGEGDSVLCCTESGLMYILYWDGGNWCVPTGEPHHWVNHKTGWHDKVIAWMPLPKPYKGEQIDSNT